MDKIMFKPIGKVITNPKYNYDTPLKQLKAEKSSVWVYPEFSKALLNIKECEYLDIIFHFDRNEGTESTLSGKTFSGQERGVFASRSPKRPNLIGVTTVKLLEIHDNELVVEGLDALDETPILDIKCCDTSIFENNADSIHLSLLKANPRMEINNLIAAHNVDLLLVKAGQLHGHICPGLAMGIMASLYAIDYLQLDIANLDKIKIICETRICLTDGVQFITGCTFANKKSFFYEPTDDVAFTFYIEEGKKIRIKAKDDSSEVIKSACPDPADRAFGTLQIPFEKLFEIY
jgi:formylmethanofuran dehydrogenase subunit E